MERVLLIIMAFLFAQSADGQTIEPGAGTFTGTVQFNYHDCTIQGAGVDATTVIADGSSPNVFVRRAAGALSDGLPVRAFTLKDLTIDCAHLDAVLKGFGGGCVITAERVKVVNTVRAAQAAYCGAGGAMSIVDLQHYGDGRGVLVDVGAGSLTLRKLRQHGGRAAVLITDGGTVGALVGTTISDVEARTDYWQSPTWESCDPTAYGAQYVDVTSHVSADRSAYDVLRAMTPVTTYTVGQQLTGALRWDRVEVTGDAANGSPRRWAQVDDVTTDGVAVLGVWHDAGTWNPCDEPTGEGATVYRMTLGRLGPSQWTTTRLSLDTNGGTAPDAHWRTIDGDTAATPAVIAGSRLDVLRVGSGSSGDLPDYAVFVGQSARSARLVDVHVHGSYSDSVVINAPGSEIWTSSMDLGHDLGLHLNGSYGGGLSAYGFRARRPGFNGIYINGAPATLVRCRSDQSGIHDDGRGTFWGVRVYDAAASGDYTGVAGVGNIDGLIGGNGA